MNILIVEDEVMAIYQNDLDLKSVKQPLYKGEATEAEKLLIPELIEAVSV